MSEKLLTSEEFKTVTKQLLKWIDTICVENNIPYFAAYGTLIGAIRHNGFIPWDDDIDICMLREDYEKFVAILNDIQDGQHYLLSSETELAYYNNFARVCDNSCILKIKGTLDIPHFGAFVDVFPLDKVPESRDERFAFYSELSDAYNNVVTSLPKSSYDTLPLKRRLNFWRRHFKYIINIFHRDKLKEYKQKRDTIMKRFNESDSKIVTCLFDNPDDRLIMNIDDISETFRHSFEDIEISIPCKYDSILRDYYGDYMKIPDEKDQYSKHHFTPYWS